MGKKKCDFLHYNITEEKFKRYVALKNKSLYAGDSFLDSDKMIMPKWTCVLKFIERKILIPFDLWFNIRFLGHNTLLKHRSYIVYPYMCAYRHYFCKKANITISDYWVSQIHYQKLSEKYKVDYFKYGLEGVNDKQDV